MQYAFLLGGARRVISPLSSGISLNVIANPISSSISLTSSLRHWNAPIALATSISSSSICQPLPMPVCMNGNRTSFFDEIRLMAKASFRINQNYRLSPQSRGILLGHRPGLFIVRQDLESPSVVDARLRVYAVGGMPQAVAAYFDRRFRIGAIPSPPPF